MTPALERQAGGAEHGLERQAVGCVPRQALAHGEWLILMFHRFDPEPDSKLAYPPRQFARAMQLIAEVGIEVETVGEVWRRLEVSGPRPTPARSCACVSTRWRRRLPTPRRRASCTASNGRTKDK